MHPKDADDMAGKVPDQTAPLIGFKSGSALSAQSQYLQILWLYFLLHLKTNILYYTELTLSHYWFYDPVM